MGAWGGYKNGAIPLSAMLNVEGNYFEPGAGRAMQAALAEIRSHGINIRINEGYRELGVPADAKVTDEHKTSTGSFNQWYAYGVHQRGGPLAAYPGGSVHGWGQAADVSPGRNSDTVASIFAKHGYKFDIPSESWHATFYGVPAQHPNKPGNVNDWRSVQTYLKAYYGYAGLVDGIPGPKTWTAAQKWLKEYWGYAGTVDGVPGPLTYAALKRAGSNLH